MVQPIYVRNGRNGPQRRHRRPRRSRESAFSVIVSAQAHKGASPLEDAFRGEAGTWLGARDLDAVDAG